MNPDLYNSVRNSLSKEQIEEYRAVGEYMYNTDASKIQTMGPRVTKSEDVDLVNYASQALRSGLDPFELTREEVSALIHFYGEKWFEKFDYSVDEVPSLTTAKLV
jgi:methanogenic corrinoid protein MtbC1